MAVSGVMAPNHKTKSAIVTSAPNAKCALRETAFAKLRELSLPSEFASVRKNKYPLKINMI